jgi:DNA-binding transcriptional LysR family regulator
MANESDIQLSISHEIQAMSVIKQLVEREIGVAVLPLDSVRESVNFGRLSARRIVSPAVVRELNMVWRADRALSAAEETIRNVVSQMILDSRAGTAGEEESGHRPKGRIQTGAPS